jgi:hypothetical protein
MEETGITIHNGLPRRNIFLRENPMLCRFATLPKDSRSAPNIWESRTRRSNDSARTGA